MVLFNHTIHALEQSLDYSTKKNQIISNNIANVDTPNFKAKDVSFKNVLSEEMDHLTTKSHPKHITFSSEQYQPYTMITKQNTQYNHNGNNVDIEKEMAELAKNQIYYRSMVDRLNGKFSTLQTVIKGGR